MIDIRDHGAVGDGKTINTAAIQAAIDTCTAGGGGTVRVAGGVYLTGTLVLKDHVLLDLAPGAELRGSPRIEDYATGCGKNMYRGESAKDRCLLFAENARNIGLVGTGTINGNGGRDVFPNEGDTDKKRPMLIRFLHCRGIRMRDITLRDPAAWTSAWLYCRDIVVDGITIESRANANGDGLDFDGCTEVRVSNASFDTSDDSICLQASRPDRPCRNVTVTNCTFVSKWAGMRIGLLSRGDFENVTVSNCVFRDIDDSGLKIQMCEGGAMRRMVFTGLVMENVPRPVFLTFCQQRACVDAPAEMAPMQSMGQMIFSDMIVDATRRGTDAAFILTGMPGHPIEAITLRNIDMRVAGGATPEEAGNQLNELDLDALAGHWPEYRCFGATVPARGLYARHVRGLNIEGFRVHAEAPDARPERVFVDAEDVQGA
jgi:polygalacturonase